MLRFVLGVMAGLVAAYLIGLRSLATISPIPATAIKVSSDGATYTFGTDSATHADFTVTTI